MFKKTNLLALLIFIAFMAVPAQGANIHVRFFESADIFLTDAEFQIFSLQALENEQITIVAYGLEDGITPSLTLFDQNGMTLAEDLNPDEDDVAVINAELMPENGVYTFVLGRGDVGGLTRVMLFEGEPFDADSSILDTVDPLLPSRAYFAAGDDTAPVQMTIMVLDDGDEETPIPPVYAARGTEIDAPEAEERARSVETFTWENADGDIFYTLNVRATPEPLPTSHKLNLHLSRMAQFSGAINYQINFGAGIDDPAQILRPECSAVANVGAIFLRGPDEDLFRANAPLRAERTVQIAGENSAYYLVIDPDQPNGSSWVLKRDVRLTSELDSLECSRVQTVSAPIPTEDNTRATSDSRGSSASDDPFGGLSPLDEDTKDEPTDEEIEKDSFIRNPPPCTEDCFDDDDDNDNDVVVVGSFSVSLFCDTVNGKVLLAYSGLPDNDTFYFNGTVTGAALPWFDSSDDDDDTWDHLSTPPVASITYSYSGGSGNLSCP